ncbi:MAG: glycosyltransferase [Pseudomonadota bacterium]
MRENLMQRPLTAPVAYLVSGYPKLSHTFIQREVAGLRAAGLDVLTCSVRRPGPADLAGPEEREAAATTFYVLARARNLWHLISDHLALLAMRPGGWLQALALAWRTRPPGLKALLWQLFYFAEAGVLARYLSRKGARHLHAHFANAGGSVAMLSAAMAEIPYSFTMHGPAEFFEARHWRLDEKVARARFVACISHFCRSQLMVFADRAHWPKLRIVHCGVDPARYDGQRPPPGQRLLFVGRLAGEKGVPVLLEALAALRSRHPEVHLTLVGDGPEQAELETLAGTLGIANRMTFTGAASQNAVAEHLRRADIFVLPSFAEGVPVVLMEAMAARLPVVTTRIAGIAELVEDRVSGLLVPPGDTESLTARLSDLLGDPDARARMGTAGRAAVEARFSIHIESARLATLLRAIRSEETAPAAQISRAPATAT